MVIDDLAKSIWDISMYQSHAFCFFSDSDYLHFFFLKNGLEDICSSKSFGLEVSEYWNK